MRTTGETAGNIIATIIVIHVPMNRKMAAPFTDVPISMCVCVSMFIIAGVVRRPRRM
ncbi:MAG: hypothetical protein M3456_10815 [Actinomycetota bacterium]|nr:hypothetical protein [Actinomycetota bacterium]